MANCAGCGLRMNGVTSDLEVATSEDFGSGDLAGFGGDDTVGASVYCDGAGQLRTAPAHTSSTGEASGSGSNTVGDGATVAGGVATLVLNNPSSVRAASVMAAWSVDERVDWANADAQWSFTMVATRNGLSYFTLPAFQAPNNAGPMAQVWQTSVNTVDTIAAGGTVTYELAGGVQASGGTSGAFTSAVAIRALAVTQ